MYIVILLYKRINFAETVYYLLKQILFCFLNKNSPMEFINFKKECFGIYSRNIAVCYIWEIQESELTEIIPLRCCFLFNH